MLFKDIYNFTSPCSLDKYLKQWGVTETKSVFPFNAFNSIEQMEEIESMRDDDK